MNSKNDNPRGIILVVFAMSLFAIQDSLIKFIFEKSALYEIFFGRYIVAAFLLFFFIIITKKKVSLKTQYPFLTILRVVLHFLAFSAFFISLTFMPLATTNALFFSSPFFVSIFAKFFLKEFIGIRRWSAIVFGFIGVYVVLNPNFSDFEYKNAKYLFTPNTFALSARTKIIEAMSCGTIVLTYEQNIKGILQKMKNNENILIAKNADMFIRQFKMVLQNSKLQKKISKNARKIYEKYYNPSKIIKKNVDLILRK